MVVRFGLHFSWSLCGPQGRLSTNPATGQVKARRSMHDEHLIRFNPITSRDRPKSAPYLRLKNSKRTSKCQSIGEFGTFYEKRFKNVSQCQKTEREDSLGFFNIHSVAKLQKIEGGPFGGKKLKKLQCRKNLKGRETLWSRPVLYVTQETFLVQFPGPTGEI